MIAFKFTLFALLLLVIQNTLALETSAAVMMEKEVDTASTQREVSPIQKYAFLISVR